MMSSWEFFKILLLLLLLLLLFLLLLLLLLLILLVLLLLACQRYGEKKRVKLKRTPVGAPHAHQYRNWIT